ncbi:MAG: hypothetical protein PUH25_06260, partial [Spirochaetales bacterium]|nr:hypothetical protein [Spirochaetales bacterium]
MKRSILLTLLLILSMVVFAASTSIGSATASLELNSSVPAGTGVEIPEGVTLVGNLAIQYQYGDGTPWE